MLQFKKVKETDKELAHTLVYSNGKLLGYYVKDKDTTSIETWFFETKSHLPYFKCKTQKEVKDILNKMDNGISVKIQQHFGMSMVYPKE
jgi:hypothetical protein